MFKSNDKNYLAMLAIPVILSMVLGFSLNDPTSAIASSELQVIGQDTDDVEGKRQTRNERAEEIRKSIEANDFNSFTEATEGTPFGDLITAEMFQELVTQYSLYKSGYRKSFI